MKQPVVDAVVGFAGKLRDNSQYSVDKREKCKACDVRYLCGGICRAYKDTDCTPSASHSLTW
jgi:radical SAM protein with 4Fe4S-binding SPASM domain